MKKLLTPLIVLAFILVLVFGSLAHLMYGSCQTSKWHFIIQNRYMEDYLPKWMTSLKRDNEYRVMPPPNFNGIWREWYSNGYKRYECNYLNGGKRGLGRSWYKDGVLQSTQNYKNGKRHGRFEYRYPNGNKELESYFIDGEFDGTWISWKSNGVKEYEQVWENGDFISNLKFNNDGTKK